MSYNNRSFIFAESVVGLKPYLIVEQYLIFSSRKDAEGLATTYSSTMITSSGPKKFLGLLFWIFSNESRAAIRSFLSINLNYLIIT